ncbi:MAG: SOS response-associated peptidase family protein [Erysipelotrichaceae bacterium]|nr:SOS response-associated peptidase family protein [Erysipelotrichaceae bacterium]
MCGRYFLVEDEESKSYFEKVREQTTDFASNEIFPSQNAIVLCAKEGKMEPQVMKWGYPKWDQGIIINTRSETVKEKKLFQTSYKQNRCVVLANGFYEWDKQKRKYYLTTDEHLCYFAGIYDYETKAFSILTKDSYGVLASIHPRTPVVFNQQEANDYCLGNNYDFLVQSVMPELKLHI